ncbi:restriction endonuclease subunit S [Oribacterium sp. oral taxon 108]|uniref:restriction endonuclease subunit S n=1 Tax=Oribacterium sp. oral taxon 108 TaxID=712414 RepID=UPI00067FCDF2|nr:restriction endonuclease subunit S [Oribacterium sp. oral taxon 108]
MSWDKVRLGDICTKIGSGATPKGGSSVYQKRGISFIRSQNVYNLAFDISGLVFVNEQAAERLNGVTLEENDVLLNITGDSVARTCMVPKSLLPARVNQHVAIVRPSKEKLDPFFLMYYLASPFMQSYMLNLAVGKGASRNAMTKEMIENFEIPCPHLDIQKK